MPVKWDYIKKRRGWTADIILRSLENKSWENFKLFFTVRDIEPPSKEIYSKALLAIEQQQQPTKPTVSKKAVKKTTTRKRRSSKKAVTNGNKK